MTDDKIELRMMKLELSNKEKKHVREILEVSRDAACKLLAEIEYRKTFPTLRFHRKNDDP